MHSHKHVFSFVPDKIITEKYPLEAMAVRDGICDVIEVANMSPVLRNINTKENANLTKLVNSHKNQSGNVEVANLADQLIDSKYSSPDNPRYLLIYDEIEVYTRNDIGSYIVKEEGLAIQSLNRFVKTWMKTSTALYRHIGRHTYGHLIGESTKNTLMTGTSLGHCQNECTMQKLTTISETLDNVEALRNRKLAGFCLKCVEAIRGH